jgi:hypothetical protein
METRSSILRRVYRPGRLCRFSRNQKIDEIRKLCGQTAASDAGSAVISRTYAAFESTWNLFSK